jgi:hypothetical protein
MIYPHEQNRSVHYVVCRRAFYPEYLDTCQKPSPTTGTACSDHPNGCRRITQPGHRSQDEDFAADCTALATAFFGSSATGVGKGCSSSWSYSKNSNTKNSRCRRGDLAQEASPCDPLEYTQHGQSPRLERSNHSSDMETAQSQTSFDQNLQAQPRQTGCRKIARCGRSVSKSSGQVPGIVCRREEPNPSPRPHSAGPAHEERPLRHDDPRLQTQWHNHPLRCPQYARRQGDRRLYAAPSASRIYPFPQESRWRNPGRIGPASHHRQLRHPQASTGEILAPATSSVPFALYSDFKLLVEHGRTMVSRNHRQTDPSRLLPECACIGRCH